MPSTLSPVDVSNIALTKIGAQAINSLSDTTSSSAIACNTNFTQSYQEVSRAAPWNCLIRSQILVNITQTPLPWSTSGGSSTITATAWAPNTAYLANVYVTFGGYYYQVMFNYTSTISFLNDVTTGALVQTDQPTSGNTFGTNSGSQYPSGWGYQYVLPSDFLCLQALNDNGDWTQDGSQSDDYEIMSGVTNPSTPPTYGLCIFTDAPNAVVQYIPNQPDTTQWDSMFTNCVTLKLASAIATNLRQDGGAMEQRLLQAYEVELRHARQKNGGEKQARRFNPIPSSRFNQARYVGVNS